MTATWDAVVRDVLDEARRAAGGGAALAGALRGAGVGPEASTYSESAVSNWIKGRTRPPADVVLASAALYGLSLDQRLGNRYRPPTQREGGAGGELDQLRAAFMRLEALVNARLAPARQAVEPAVKDLVAVFATRTEAQAAVPLVRMLAQAERVDAMGLSLNGICQGISDVTLAELVENGLHLRCLFLDPDGKNVHGREMEESLPGGHLAEITRTNMHALMRIRDGLSEHAAQRVKVRTYDEVIRFNITSVDGSKILVQPYLHHSRGIDSPTFLIEAREDEPHGLHPVFEAAWQGAWEGGRDA